MTNLNPEGVKEFLSYLRHLYNNVLFSRGSVLRYASHFTTCLFSFQAFGLRHQGALPYSPWKFTAFLKRSITSGLPVCLPLSSLNLHVSL